MTTAYATAQEFADFWYWSYSPEQQTEITQQLEHDAAMISIALRASGQEDCPLDATASAFLRTLNIYLSGLNHNGVCARLSNEQRAIIEREVQEHLRALRKGTITICGSSNAVPAFGFVTAPNTPQNAARAVVYDNWEV